MPAGYFASARTRAEVSVVEALADGLGLRHRSNPTAPLAPQRLPRAQEQRWGGGWGGGSGFEGGEELGPGWGVDSPPDFLVGCSGRTNTDGGRWGVEGRVELGGVYPTDSPRKIKTSHNTKHSESENAPHFSK